MKKIICFIVIIIAVITTSTFSMAISVDESDLNQYATKTGPGDVTKMLDIAGTILGFIQNIGIACGSILIIIIGIKFIVASVEEKAEYKERLGPWLIGIVLLITGTTFPNLIYKLVILFRT